MSSTWLRLGGAALVAFMVQAGAGCGVDLGNLSGGAGISTNNFIDAGDTESAPRAAGPFGEMAQLTFDASGSVAVRDRIDEPGAYAVYDIGAVSAGDYLGVDVKAASQGFDPAAAVFDENQDCMLINDDRSFYGGLLESHLRFTSRRSTAHCYVVVSASPKSDSSGDYVVQITRSTRGTMPEIQPQTVYLNFDGASGVRIGNREPVDVPMFFGSSIGPAFADYTQELIDKAVARVRRDFVAFNVEILGSNEFNVPDWPHSTVHMGSYDAALLGVADNVDAYNGHVEQNAIVFVDTFAVFGRLNPSVDEMANALANVTSHEIGHLLGLHHTKDALGIMDISASLRQMLAPQTFRSSAIHPETFRVGFQNGPKSLIEAVGASGLIPDAKTGMDIMARDPWYDQGPAIPARWYGVFGTGCFRCRLDAAEPAASGNVPIPFER